METPTASASVLDDPFAKLLEQEQAHRAQNPASATLPAPPPGGQSPFLAIPGAVLPPAPEPAVTAEETPGDTPEETPAPKRKRGRPRKNPLPDTAEAADTPAPVIDAADPVSVRDLVLSQPLDRAWIALGEHVSATESHAASLRKDVEEIERNAQEITSLQAEIAATQAVIDQLTETRNALGDEEELRRQADAAEERAVQSSALRQQVADFLVALNGGNSGTVGAVRITVIDGKAHIDRAG